MLEYLAVGVQKPTLATQAKKESTGRPWGSSQSEGKACIVCNPAPERNLGNSGILNIEELRDSLLRTNIRMNCNGHFPPSHSSPGDSNSWKNELAGSSAHPLTRRFAKLKRVVPVGGSRTDAGRCPPLTMKCCFSQASLFLISLAYLVLDSV